MTPGLMGEPDPPPSDPRASRWVCTHITSAGWIESLDGVMWGTGRLPRRFHRCRPQTRGRMNGSYVERCNCGAARMSPDGPWARRNETRIARKRKAAEDRLPRVTIACQDCGEPYEAPQGTRQAQDRLCAWCWSARFTGIPRNLPEGSKP